MSTRGGWRSGPRTTITGRALIARKDHYNVTTGSVSGTIAERPCKSFFKVRVNHDGSAWIVDTGRPGNYRRHIIAEVYAHDAFDAIKLARNM